MSRWKMRETCVRVIYFSSFFVLLLLLLTIFALSLYYFLLKRKVNEKVWEKSNVYQYNEYQYNPQLNKTSFIGYVTLMEEIENVIQIHSSDGTILYLLSKFGDRFYECTGTCFCSSNEDERRFSSSKILSKGMKFLVSAISVITALEIVKDSIQNECFEKHNEICSSSSYSSSTIESEVEGCKEYIVDYEMPFMDVRFKMEYLVKKGYPVFREEREFFCKGNCLTSQKTMKRILFSKEGTDELKERSKNMKCEEMKISAKVFFSTDEPTTTDKKGELYAYYEFSKQLTRFCREGSEIEVIGLRNMKKKLNICLGRDKMGQNPSVNCKLMKVSDNRDELGTEEDRWRIVHHYYDDYTEDFLDDIDDEHDEDAREEYTEI